MFDSIGIIELDASQNRDLAGVGKATRKKNWGSFKGGHYNESLVQKNKRYGIGLDDDDDDDHDNDLRRRSGRISPAGYEGVSTGPDPDN